MEQRSRRRVGVGRFWLWPVLWFGTLVLISGTAVMAFRQLTQVSPLPKCEELSPLAAEKERLRCAVLMAQSGELEDLEAALKLTAFGSPEHPLFEEARPWIVEWSEGLLAIAYQTLSQGDLDKALAIVEKIPAHSPAHADAQRVVAVWEERWLQGQSAYEAVQAAIQAQDWAEAEQKIQALEQARSPYWRLKGRQALVEQVRQEKQAWQQLEEARQLAKKQTTSDLGKAIALLQDIAPGVQARPQIQAAITDWSQRLLKIAIQRLEAGDWRGMQAAARQIPENSTLAANARNFVQLARAHTVAEQETLFALLEAHAAVQQVNPNSRPYPQAQEDIAAWQTQIQDLAQIWVARAIASFELIPAFQLASDQAQAIAIDRPRRIQAQTLIAHWRKEIQRVEDRSYIVRAERLAEPETREALQAAIAAANQIEQGRSLHAEAQTLVSQWNQQIQVIEDQPILDEARTLAQQGNLWAAVEVADQIAPNRALYTEAQTEIVDWRYQAQRSEDQTILGEASSLAAIGSLTRAINTAAEIGPGRPLYDEAQAAIDQWSQERAAIWTQRAESAESATEATAPAEDTEGEGNSEVEQASFDSSEANGSGQ